MICTQRARAVSDWPEGGREGERDGRTGGSQPLVEQRHVYIDNTGSHPRTQLDRSDRHGDYYYYHLTLLTYYN